MVRHYRDVPGIYSLQVSERYEQARQAHHLLILNLSFFRDDFSPKFVALFSLLLFLKSFHWLAEDRVDYMERSPSISLLFHIRYNS